MREIKDFFNIEKIEEIDFKEVCGFYFAFKITHIFINEKISSSQIKPVAIIYSEKDEYYLACLDYEEETGKIVRNFTEKCL